MTAFTSFNLQGWRSCIFAWLIVDTVIFVNSGIEMTVYNCVRVEIMNSSVPTQLIVIDQTFGKSRYIRNMFVHAVHNCPTTNYKGTSSSNRRNAMFSATLFYQKVK